MHDGTVNSHAWWNCKFTCMMEL